MVSALPPLAWTPRALLLFLAAGGLLVAGIALRSPVALLLALPLLLAPVGAGLLSVEPGGPAQVHMSDAMAGPSVEIVGTVRLPTGIDARDVRIHLRLPPPLVAEGAARIHGEATVVEFSQPTLARIPCLLRIPLPVILWEDPLGLARRRLSVTGEELSLERFPPEIARLSRLRLERTTARTGEIPSPATGASGEFSSVRDYLPGDSPRSINWKATARAGSLQANEYSLERTGDVFVLIDGRPSGLGAAADEILGGVNRAAALGISDHFLREKSRVGVGIFTEFLEAVPLGSGRRQHHRIRELLGKSPRKGAPGPSERCAIALRRVLAPGVTTFLLSSLAEETGRALILYLRQRGYPVLVVSPSPVGLLPTSTPPTRRDQVVLRLARLARRITVGRVWSSAPVVDWEDYWSLQGLTRLFSSRGARRRRA